MGVKRSWVRDAGGVWTADSPRVLADLVDTLEAVGLAPLITAYLGERPVLSVNKCTLRRVGVEPGNANWHQDGAFLGEGIRSLNVWMSLSHCGVDAPGLDVVPRRFDGGARDRHRRRDLPLDRRPGPHRPGVRGEPGVPPNVRTGRRAAVRRPVPPPHRGRPHHAATCATRSRPGSSRRPAYPDGQIPLVF